ncbi:hypothetical protein SNEBB_001551 [Seison nebaliae]|nr:hypothetical protein SNEBB_001551 [Seison nebaliae]
MMDKGNNMNSKSSKSLHESIRLVDIDKTVSLVSHQFGGGGMTTSITHTKTICGHQRIMCVYEESTICYRGEISFVFFTNLSSPITNQSTLVHLLTLAQLREKRSYQSITHWLEKLKPIDIVVPFHIFDQHRHNQLFYTIIELMPNATIYLVKNHQFNPIHGEELLKRILFKYPSSDIFDYCHSHSLIYSSLNALHHFIRIQTNGYDFLSSKCQFNLLNISHFIYYEYSLLYRLNILPSSGLRVDESLFELLSTSLSISGRKYLKELLINPKTDLIEIEERHNFVRYLLQPIGKRQLKRYECFKKDVFHSYQDLTYLIRYLHSSLYNEQLEVSKVNIDDTAIIERRKKQHESWEKEFIEMIKRFFLNKQLSYNNDERMLTNEMRVENVKEKDLQEILERNVIAIVENKYKNSMKSLRQDTNILDKKKQFNCICRVNHIIYLIHTINKCRKDLLKYLNDGSERIRSKLARNYYLELKDNIEIDILLWIFNQIFDMEIIQLSSDQFSQTSQTQQTHVSQYDFVEDSEIVKESITLLKKRHYLIKNDDRMIILKELRDSYRRCIFDLRKYATKLRLVINEKYIDVNHSQLLENFKIEMNFKNFQCSSFQINSANISKLFLENNSPNDFFQLTNRESFHIISLTTNQMKFRTSTLMVVNEKIEWIRNILLMYTNDMIEIIFRLVIHCYESISKLIDILTVVEVWTSLTSIFDQGHFVQPKIHESYSGIFIKNSCHPILFLKKSNGQFKNQLFTNQVDVNYSSNIHLISGKHSSGKSIYVKQIALLQWMAQIGFFVPSSSMETHIFHSMFVLDDGERETGKLISLQEEQIQFVNRLFAYIHDDFPFLHGVPGINTTSIAKKRKFVFVVLDELGRYGNDESFEAQMIFDAIYQMLYQKDISNGSLQILSFIVTHNQLVKEGGNEKKLNSLISFFTSQSINFHHFINYKLHNLHEIEINDGTNVHGAQFMLEKGQSEDFNAILRRNLQERICNDAIDVEMSDLSLQDPMVSFGDSSFENKSKERNLMEKTESITAFVRSMRGNIIYPTNPLSATQFLDEVKFTSNTLNDELSHLYKLIKDNSK